jgi:hypothetical protein
VRDTPGTRYAVVSCHVERPLDDRVWPAFARFQEQRAGGFPVAALLRPPDSASGEDEQTWLERAREAAARGPLGHHTHWTSPSHARPDGDGALDAGARVLREGAWLRERGLAPTLFCGGGWYTDASVATACVTLGYVDCTPRAARPPYLDDQSRWAELAAPARLRLEGGVLLAVPTTRSVGDLVRAVARPWTLDEEVVHVYCHDTDLVDGRRRRLLVSALALLGRRRQRSDLDTVSSRLLPTAPERDWSEVARGGDAARPQ